MTDNDLLATLQALEAELHHPGLPCTAARLDELLHPGFHEVGRSGRPYSRNFVIGFLLDRPQPDYRVEAGDYRVHELGADAALLTYGSRHILPDGAVGHAALRSSVWLRTARGWQLFYHQGTPTEAS